jgi:hypothetical protein
MDKGIGIAFGNPESNYGRVAASLMSHFVLVIATTLFFL